jgi:hypothetical protein
MSGEQFQAAASSATFNPFPLQPSVSSEGHVIIDQCSLMAVSVVSMSEVMSLRAEMLIQSSLTSAFIQQSR